MTGREISKDLEIAAYWPVVDAAVLGLKPEPTIGGGGGARSAADTSSPAFLQIFNCDGNAESFNKVQESKQKVIGSFLFLLSTFCHL